MISSKEVDVGGGEVQWSPIQNSNAIFKGGSDLSAGRHIAQCRLQTVVRSMSMYGCTRAQFALQNLRVFRRYDHVISSLNLPILLSYKADLGSILDKWEGSRCRKVGVEPLPFLLI